jgi:hypothetical protein
MYNRSICIPVHINIKRFFPETSQRHTVCERKVAVTGSTRVVANKIYATQLVVQNINSRHSGLFQAILDVAHAGALYVSNGPYQYSSNNSLFPECEEASRSGRLHCQGLSLELRAAFSNVKQMFRHSLLRRHRRAVSYKQIPLHRKWRSTFLPKRRLSTQQTAALTPHRAVCVLRRHRPMGKGKGAVCVNLESKASF